MKDCLLVSYYFHCSDLPADGNEMCVAVIHVSRGSSFKQIWTLEMQGAINMFSVRMAGCGGSNHQIMYT